MQAQLDYQEQSGAFNLMVAELLQGAISPDGTLLTDSELMTLLKEQENWSAMSAVSKEVWEEELNNTFKEVVAFLLKQNAEENGTFYTALTSAIEGVSTVIGSYSQAMTKLGDTVSSAASGGGGGGGGGGGYSGGYTGSSTPSPKKPPQTPQTESLYGVNNASAGINLNTGAPKITINTSNVSVPVVGGRINPYTGAKTRYATGGLADFAGLAYLDGSPSEPEYVLNARQTDAFLKLADVLPSMMGSGASAQTNTFGSTYITMPVTLESVNPDYDVDRMVDLLKDKLYDVGSYRNVNSLSLMR